MLVESASQQDVITTEVFANLFKAVVDEMAWIILRSSHTTFVKETQDFAAGLVTKEGEIFAYPYSSGATPIMGVPMHAGTQAIPHWAPGDILMANDPYTTGGMVMHLNDIYLFKPIFVDGRVICFAWAFIHCTDVGGYAPGSIDMQNHEVFQEGLRLRPVKLYRQGELNEDVWNLFADNCRIPSLNWGDMSALVAALGTAERRLQRLAERYGCADLEQAIYATLDRTEQLTRTVLARIPKGEYRFVDYFEDDYVSGLPVRIELKLISRGDGTICVDYTGSDPQVRAALNLPTGGMRRHPFLSLGIVNYVVTQSESLHLNAGILRCIELTLPEASVVNAAFPAAVGMRFTTAMRVHDMLLGALNQALPGSVPAGGASSVVVSYISTSDLGQSGRVVVANPVPGGSGGGPALDGVSGSDFSVGFLRSVPVEVLESEAPVLVHRFGLRADSEGAGEYRGGFGTEYDIEIRHPSAVVVMRGKDRHRFTSWGVLGGRAGAAGGNVGTVPGQAARDLGKRTVYRAALGEVISIQGGGGGGFGDPLDRDPGSVARDVRNGLVTPTRAQEVYGVVMAGDRPDHAATRALRSGRTRGQASRGDFDFGAARVEWERVYGVAAECIAQWLPRLQAPLRRIAQEMAYRALAASGPGPYAASDVSRAIDEVQALIGTDATLQR